MSLITFNEFFNLGTLAVISRYIKKVNRLNKLYLYLAWQYCFVKINCHFATTTSASKNVNEFCSVLESILVRSSKIIILIKRTNLGNHYIISICFLFRTFPLWCTGYSAPSLLWSYKNQS